MPNYNNGKIYKIYNTITDDIYIGATTQLLSARMREHRRASKDIKKILNYIGILTNTTKNIFYRVIRIL